jgi:hypothetical protein
LTLRCFLVYSYGSIKIVKEGGTMSKPVIVVALVVLALCMCSYSFAEGTYAGEAVKESVKASGAASKGSMHSIAASGQVTSAVSAVPLLVGGSVGAVSGKAGSELMQSASQPIGKPLEVTEEAVTVGPPPDQVLKTKTPAQN